MQKLKIAIADTSYLIREGFRSIIQSQPDFKLVGEAENAEELTELLMIQRPQVLILDYTSPNFSLDDISVIAGQFKEVHILAVTGPQGRPIISKALDNGVMSHLLKDCGKEEIIEAITLTGKGHKFFCGKILDIVLKGQDAPVSYESVSCEGVKLSSREVEIVQLVAEGLTNKQIADKLFLSTHTVTTHRKNIMSKLGVNNTAGLVMFAIRQNLLPTGKNIFAAN